MATGTNSWVVARETYLATLLEAALSAALAAEVAEIIYNYDWDLGSVLYRSKNNRLS